MADEIHTPEQLIAVIREGRRTACPHCRHPNPPGQRFCSSCGLRLKFPCPQCNAPCQSGQSFCGSCGVSLAEVLNDHFAQLEAGEADARAAREADPLRRYRTLRTIEEGRMSHMLGVTPEGERHFLKVARSATGKRLMANELSALADLEDVQGIQHPVHTYSDDQHAVVAFEQLHNPALRFPVDIPELLQLTIDVLEILSAVHARGWVHCDLKPAHLMQRADGQLALVDFDIAQKPGPSAFGAYTALFAAPEQIVGDALDHRVDLHAVGVMLYMLFTYDRFPAVLEERTESEAYIGVLKARPAKNRAYLSGQTMYVGKGSLSKVAGAPQNMAGPPTNTEAEKRRVLGAKYLFSAELKRTCDVNAEIRLAGEVMRVVRTACAVDPEARYPSAEVMAADLRLIMEGAR
ncbi:MAG: inactive serine/threonine-protein kinase VRK3 [Bradymonadia bacterium]